MLFRSKEFNSNTTQILDRRQVMDKLLALPYIREELEGFKK